MTFTPRVIHISDSCLLARLGSTAELFLFGSLSLVSFSKLMGAPLEEMVCEGCLHTQDSVASAGKEGVLG